MKEPRRLLSSDNEFDRMLLCAGLEEAPPSGSLDKTLLSLGVSTGAVLAAGATATVASASGLSSGSAATIASGSAATSVGVAGVGATVVKTAATSMSFGKLFGAIAIAGGVATGGLVVERTYGHQDVPVVEAAAPANPNVTAPNLAPNLTAPNAATPSRGEALGQTPAEPSKAEIPAAEPTPLDASPASPEAARDTVTPKRAETASSPNDKKPTAKKPEPAAGKLTEELKMLDGARAHLRSGQASAALGEVDQYRRKFPKGALAAEASALRIEILSELGRKDEARTAAESYKQQFPDGAYSHRVEATIEKNDAK